MFIPTIQQFLNRNIKDDQSTTILVGVSGGVDSVVLCHVLKSLEHNFAIAHMNFGLRGEDSDEDEKLVRDLSQKLQVKYHVKSVDTSLEAQEKGESIQMVARSLRYDWFEALCNEFDYTHIATAHHQNDQVETVILNLVRGSGIAGLRGMKHVQGNLIRPLLNVRKDELVAYANENGLFWREDKSNDDVKYKRNLIRHKVIPLLEGANPRLIQTVARSVERLQEEEAVMIAYASLLKPKYVAVEDQLVKIDLSNWFKKKGASVVLYQWIKEFEFSYADVQRIIATGVETSGKQFYSKSHTLACDRNQLVITANDDELDWEVSFDLNDGEVQSPLGSLYIRKGVGDVELGKSTCVAHVDASKLDEELTLRTWREGDTFYPLGMSGKKKLSDFMIDNKIPVNLKNRIPLLYRGSDIVWVVGHRLDDRFKITEGTDEIIELEWI